MIKSTDIIKERLENASLAKKMGKIGAQYCCNIKDIEFKYNYDCIYMCWGFLYMNDADVIKFLWKARKALTKKNQQGNSGVIISKENVQDLGKESELNTELI